MTRTGCAGYSLGTTVGVWEGPNGRYGIIYDGNDVPDSQWPRWSCAGVSRRGTQWGGWAGFGHCWGCMGRSLGVHNFGKDVQEEGEAVILILITTVKRAITSMMVRMMRTGSAAARSKARVRARTNRGN